MPPGLAIIAAVPHAIFLTHSDDRPREINAPLIGIAGFADTKDRLVGVLRVGGRGLAAGHERQQHALIERNAIVVEGKQYPLLRYRGLAVRRSGRSRRA